MKRTICVLLILGLTLACFGAGADTKVDATGDRGITIQKAGENTAEENISPVTGRKLDTIEVPEGFSGMAKTKKYYPVLVQHNGYASGLGNAAPWFGSYADVIYEMAKTSTGTARLTLVYNDVYPVYVGASRSIRTGHFYIQQDWDAPFLYHGVQTGSPSTEYNTNVEELARANGVPLPGTLSVPFEDHVLLDGQALKPWTNWHYRVKGLSNACNVVWNLQGVVEGLNPDRQFRNHTWKFSETLPEGGDEAGTVYVIFNNDHDKSTGADEDGTYYFNSMLQYEPEENVYYRYLLKEKGNPDTAILFEELAPTSIQPYKEDGEQKISASLEHGNPITFSNVIVQFMETKWTSGDTPYAVMTGSGNADYFMGGKHYAGVWNRETVKDRTVFYGADGQEIALQPGKTLVVVMDANVSLREIRYE